MTNEQDTLELGIPEPEDWKDTAMDALERVAARGQPFQAYDLTLEGVPDPEHPNAWGSLFAAAQSDNVITPLGWTYSKRPTRSFGVCREWIGTEFTKQTHQLVA